MAGLQDLMSLLGGGAMSTADIRALKGAFGLLPGTPKAPGEETGLYWDARHPSRGGTQRVESSVGAPSADHYRLVDSLEEAQDVMGRGEHPLLVGNLADIDPNEIDPGVLRKLQEDQWAAPGGTPLFSDTGITPRGLQGLVQR